MNTARHYLTFAVVCVGLLLLQPAVHAQSEITVEGTVTDEQQTPLPGANIVVKGNPSIGSVSGSEGQYSVTAPSPRDTLVFSYVGYEAQEVPIEGRTTIDVTLTPATLGGEEVVVVGYGTQQREDVTGSVSVVDVEGLQQSTQTSLAGALEGKVSGVSVQTTGAPGEEPAINV